MDPLKLLAEQYRADRPWKRGLFKQQRAVLASKHKRKAVRCSRRAGKTVCAAAALAEDLDLAGFDEAVVYAAKTRDVSKRLVWAKLCALASQVQGWRIKESELQVWNERGGYIQLVGLDKPAEIEKLRGLKMRAFHGDEPATYASLLQSLMQDIVEPALGDVRGSITFYGTPGPTLSGYWYDISSGDNPEWELHHWTTADNPHFPDHAGYIAERLRKNGWDSQHPTHIREDMGEWCDDADARVYAYKSALNDCGAIPPDYDKDRWVHAIGVDFGVVDPCAWVVLASHPHERVAYAVYTYEQSGLLVDQAADLTANLVAEFKPRILVGDAGGLGKPYVDLFNERHGAALKMQMLAAEKREKRAQIDILNTDFRTRRVRLCQPASKALSTCLVNLPWEDETKLTEHQMFPNHLTDALLYAHRHFYNYMHVAPDPIGPTLHHQRPCDPAWIEREEASVRREDGVAWWDR